MAASLKARSASEGNGDWPSLALRAFRPRGNENKILVVNVHNRLTHPRKTLACFHVAEIQPKGRVKAFDNYAGSLRRPPVLSVFQEIPHEMDYS